MSLQELVSTALDNALDNGYDQRDADPEQVAIDLATYDSDIEANSIELIELTKLVVVWQTSKKS